MGEWAPTATAAEASAGIQQPSRWGNGRQPQRRPVNRLLGGQPSRWGNGRQPQLILARITESISLADGGMGANRNYPPVFMCVDASLADGGMGANRNRVLNNGWLIPA